jgi:hypothetical protein
LALAVWCFGTYLGMNRWHVNTAKSQSVRPAHCCTDTDCTEWSKRAANLIASFPFPSVSQWFYQHGQCPKLVKATVPTNGSPLQRTLCGTAGTTVALMPSFDLTLWPF